MVRVSDVCWGTVVQPHDVKRLQEEQQKMKTLPKQWGASKASRGRRCKYFAARHLCLPLDAVHLNHPLPCYPPRTQEEKNHVLPALVMRR